MSIFCRSCWQIAIFLVCNWTLIESANELYDYVYFIFAVISYHFVGALVLPISDFGWLPMDFKTTVDGCIINCALFSFVHIIILKLHVSLRWELTWGLPHTERILHSHRQKQLLHESFTSRQASLLKSTNFTTSFSFQNTPSLLPCWTRVFQTCW